LRELTELAGNVTGRRMEIGSDPEVREGDIPLYITDAAGARDKFNWHPVRSVEDIAFDMERWLSDNEERLRTVFC
jgi:CDP-paratose 2-epimerase